MDINATLETIRNLTARMLDGVVSEDDAIELAEATHSLDEWLSKGGFLPADWSTR